MAEPTSHKPKDYKAIMLSGGFAYREEYREIAVQAVKEAGYVPIPAERFESLQAVATRTSEIAGRSAALICFFDRWSVDVLRPLEVEMEEASRQGLPILALIQSNIDFSGSRADPRMQAQLEETLNRVTDRAHVTTFNDAKELYFAIQRALVDFAQRSESSGERLSSERLVTEPSRESARQEGSRQRAESNDPPGEAPPSESAESPLSVGSSSFENLQTAPFYSDHAARSDLLNRKAVAETVATMIENVWREDDKEENIDRTFMVHLHGRWGSGKTSILNFLRDSLLSQKSGGPPNEVTGPPWVVIDYNAWRNQALGPAWWTLMETVYRQGRKQLGGWCTESGQRVILRDRLWRIGSSYAPYALVAALLIALGLLLIFIWKDSVLDSGKSWIEEGVKFIVSVVGLVAAVFAFGHSYPIGSARTAKSYLELSRDPLNPLIRRYGGLVQDIGRPVAVFIDDLDRCNAEFVVELLQTIQTLFRNARVLYVVAADRDWVCASYQQIYKTFNDSIGEPGKSLGHLFVEKVFQLSVEVPRLSAQERNRYWEELLKSNAPLESKVQQERIDEATRAIESAHTESRIIEIVDLYRNDPGVAQIVAAKAFRQMQAAPIEKERQHFLNKYALLIEPNPRAMKRLLNAYGFRRGFDIQSRHRSDPDALVRWTILENRWPILADYLEGRTAGSAIIEALIKDKSVLEVADGLTWEKLRPVASAPDEPPKPETTPGTAKK